MAKNRLTYGQIRKLWLKHGGNKAWSYVMAAVAEAESGGGYINPTPHRDVTNGVVTYDYGLWQINSSHGYDVHKLRTDPDYNAMAAVHIFNGAGPTAWSAFNDHAFLQHMPKGQQVPASGSGQPGFVDPVAGGTYVRVDQGVDYSTTHPVVAMVGGKITHIDYSMARGENVASHALVEERFDHPIDIQGRKYYGQYFSEEDPLVHTGQHVVAGQPVIKAGSDELGYLSGKNLAFPPLLGGLGPATKPTQEGQDYAQTVVTLGGPGPTGVLPFLPGQITGPDIKAYTNPSGGTTLDSIGSGIASGFASLGGVFSGAFSGLVAALYQFAFMAVGLGLALVGLYLIFRAVMGTGAAPPLIREAERIATIRQQGRRVALSERRGIEGERASRVRETQATQRIRGQASQRAIQRQRLSVQSRAVERREAEPTNIAYPRDARFHERTIRNTRRYRNT